VLERILAWSFGATIALFASAASAHIDLQEPTPRHGRDELKEGPCGVAGSARSRTPSYFEPGDEVTLVWDEYVDHPGHVRIMFSLDGDDFPDPSGFDDLCNPAADAACIADGLQEGGGGTYEHTFTLPNAECSNCTIQVIQVMTDKAPYGDGNDIYYDCADIVITTNPPPSADDGSGGGCSLAHRTQPAGYGIVAILLALLAARLRRPARR
jgi:hypothetical protein